MLIVFVKALLGQPACLSLPALRAFLQLDSWYPSAAAGEPCFTPVQRSDSFMTKSAGQDKWRRLFTSLRVKLKPKEVAVSLSLVQQYESV